MQGKVEICGINTAKLEVLKNDEMTELLRRTKEGDMAAREKLIRGNLRLVQQGGITVGDKKVDSIDASFGCQEFTGDGLIIRKGKKVFHRAVLI